LDIEFIDHLYTDDSELQAITAPSLISTIHKSQQYTLSLFQPAAFTSRSLVMASTVELLQFHALKSSLNGGSLSTATFSHRLPLCAERVETPFPAVPLLLHAYPFPRERVYQSVA
jgi:hypothetical protein